MNRTWWGGVSSAILLLVVCIRVCSALTSSGTQSFTANDEAWAALDRDTSDASTALKTALANGDQAGAQVARFELQASCLRMASLKPSQTVFEELVHYECSQLDTLQASPTPAAGVAAATTNYRPITGTATPAHALPSLKPLSCEQQGTPRARTSSTLGSITFVNLTASPVALYWIDGSGARVLYSTLPPQTQVRQQTYATDTWLAATTDGSCLAIFEAVAGDASATIR
jgi:hypothetical protein